MKLLFDHNLSPRLVTRLADRYPGSQHAFLLDMGEADDLEIWHFAQQHSYVVVTRDSDYNDLSLVRGLPPKVIWIRRGNCSTADIEALLRAAEKTIEDFGQSSSSGVLTLLQESGLRLRIHPISSESGDRVFCSPTAVSTQG